MAKTTVRDIIVNALDEAGLVNRNQPAPGNMVESAYNLFSRRIDEYSNTNYLSFTRKEVDVDITKEQMILGEGELTEDAEDNVLFCINELDKPNPALVEVGIYLYLTEDKVCYQAIDSEWVSVPNNKVWELEYDVYVPNLQEVVACYDDGNNELNFVSYEDWYGYDCSQIYSVLPIDDCNMKLFTHQKQVKVIYNESFDFDLNSVLRIPKQFISLFTTGLTYDLSVKYPRLSDNTIARIFDRLDKLEKNVRRSSAKNKFLGRKPNTYCNTYSNFIQGNFLK